MGAVQQRSCRRDTSNAYGVIDADVSGREAVPSYWVPGLGLRKAVVDTIELRWDAGGLLRSASLRTACGQ